MSSGRPRSAIYDRGKRLFAGAFALACLLFWWLPTVLFRLMGLDDSVSSWAIWISLIGFATFAVGYILPPLRPRTFSNPRMIDACEGIAYTATVWLAVPAALLAFRFFLSRAGLEYGQGDQIPLSYQAVFYGHMFFAFLFLGASRGVSQDRRRIIIASLAVIIPRLIVSLRWGRFFLAQAVIPIILVAVARGWIRLSAKRVLQLSALGLFILFVPALSRGSIFGQDDLIAFFQAGSSLRLLQNNRDLNLTGLCPPLLVSMTDKVIPYHLLGACTIEYQGATGQPATLDRILTEDDPSTVGTLEGTGSNYLLELYLTGGLAAIVIGSTLLGYTSCCFIEWLGERSLLSGIWAECLSRTLLAPRSTLGYVYERIPSLILAIMMVLLFVWLRNLGPILARAESLTAKSKEQMN